MHQAESDKGNSSLDFSQSSMVVRHNIEKKQFEISLPNLPGNAMAVLEYTEPQAGVLDLWHTEVPHELRNRGIAKLLAKEAFDYVVESDLKMIISCSYLQMYYNNNPRPEYTHRILK